MRQVVGVVTGIGENPVRFPNVGVKPKNYSALLSPAKGIEHTSRLSYLRMWMNLV